MSVELNRALDALQQAHEAGNKEHAEQLADYVRSLQAQNAAAEEPIEDPATKVGQATAGVVGSILGSTAGQGLSNRAARSAMGDVKDELKDSLTSAKATKNATIAQANAELQMAKEKALKDNPFKAPPAAGKVDAGAVENWARAEHAGEFYGGKDYADADAIAREAKAFNKANSQFQVPEGGQTRLALPVDLKAKPVIEAAPTQPAANPALDRVVATGARQRAIEGARMLEAQQIAKARKAAEAAQSQIVAGPSRMASGLAGAGAGVNAEGLYRHATQGDVSSAVVNALGLGGSGLGILSPNKYARRAGIVAGAVAPFISESLSGNRKPEERAAGGAIQHLAKGGKILDLLMTAPKKAFAPIESRAVKASEALGAHEGKKLGLTQTDNFGVHGGRMGGNQFPNFQNISPKHQEAGVVWMNDAEKHANDMVKKSGDDTVWSTYIGGADQLKSNKTVFNDILNQHYQRELTPEQIELINRRIATMRKGKDGPMVFPNQFDIRDKYATSELAGDTFDRRSALASMLGEGEGIGRTKTGIALPQYQDILRSHRDPLTEGVPTSSIGTRLFTVDSKRPAEFRQDLHPDYNYAVYGKDQGVQFAPVPHKLATPDFYERQFAKTGLAPHGNSWFGYMKDPQRITEEYLTRLQKEGYAQGGLVHLAGGGAIKLAKAGLNALTKNQHSQDPRVAQALEEYLKGNISQQERIRIMNEFLPTRQWSELPPNYSDEQIKNALMANKQSKALAPVPAGVRVGNRLDIPAYTQHGVYVDTTHDLSKGNAPISYNRTGHLKDVEFSSKPNQAVRVGLGTKEQALTPMGVEMGSAKSPFALIKGTNIGTSDDEVRRMMAEMMQDPRYTQIGMDPRKHSQFYDKSTGMPVWAAEEKLQSGPLILVPKQGLESTSWDDPRLNLSDFEGKKYASGGKV